MTPPTPRSLFRALAGVLTVALAAPAAAADEELRFSPPDPTTLDPITAILSGEWPNSCTPELRGVEIEGDLVEIEAQTEFPGAVCSQVITPYETAIDIGRLQQGTYTVSVLADPESSSPEILVQEQLVVEGSGDLGLDTIDVSPARPSPQDRITISAQGTWPDGCVPRLEDVQVEERTVQLYAAAEGEGCPQVLTDFTVTATVGPLAVGRWMVEVLIADRRAGDIGARYELAGERSFLVGPAEADTVVVGGRFEIAVTWTDGVDDSGVGQPLRGALPDRQGSGSAAFYFFEPVNTELLVKVLDGCALNDHFWVFVSAATDLGIDLRVTDLAAGGVSRVYTNAPGVPARAVTDVEAFATCDPP